ISEPLDEGTLGFDSLAKASAGLLHIDRSIDLAYLEQGGDRIRLRLSIAGGCSLGLCCALRLTQLPPCFERLRERLGRAAQVRVDQHGGRFRELLTKPLARVASDAGQIPGPRA